MARVSPAIGCLNKTKPNKCYENLQGVIQDAGLVLSILHHHSGWQDSQVKTYTIATEGKLASQALWANSATFSYPLDEFYRVRLKSGRSRTDTWNFVSSLIEKLAIELTFKIFKQNRGKHCCIHRDPTCWLWKLIEINSGQHEWKLW